MLKSLLWLGLVWACTVLGFQLARAWGGGRREHGRPTGSAWQGLIYNFTGAMLPAHKETAYRHVGEFALGVVLHLGVVSVAAATLLWLLWTRGGLTAFAIVRPLAAIALLAGLILQVRRMLSGTLRAVSTPDDFVANAATCLWLACAALCAGTLAHGFYVGCTFLVLLYLPLGKLRHSVFFYAARADLGRRLGRRGTYPPSRVGAERIHG